MAKGDEEEGPRSFSVIIQQLADGQAHEDLSTELHELLVQLKEHAQEVKKASGKLTLELSFHVSGNGVVGIDYDVKVRMPKKARPEGVFWLTKGGNLTPHNPKQQELPLREVPGGKAELREGTAKRGVREI